MRRAPLRGGPIRVCIYTDSGIVAGAERVLCDLLPELSSDVEVTVIGTDASTVDTIAAGRPATTKVVVAPVRSKFDLRGLWRHRRAIVKAQPDVFHANLTWLWSCRYALAMALTIPGLRVVAVEHLLVEPTHRGAKPLKRFLSRRLAAHVTVGYSLCRPFESCIGLPSGSMIGIPNGVSSITPPARRPTTDRTVIGTVARLDPSKGVDLVVEVAAALPEVFLVIVGDGPSRADLEALVTERGCCDRVLFTGWVDDSRRWLAGMDVFVLGSAQEGLPLSVLEAMFAGVPVVATDVGGVAEAVVDGTTGLLVPVGDGEALLSSVRRLVEDVDLRRQLGEAGRARAAERFTASRMAHTYEALYRRLASEGRRRKS